MVNVDELKKLQNSLGNDNFIIEAIDCGIIEAVANGECKMVYSIDSDCDLELEISEAIRYYTDLGFDVDDDIKYEQNEAYDEEEADYEDEYCTEGTLTISWGW